MNCIFTNKCEVEPGDIVRKGDKFFLVVIDTAQVVAKYMLVDLKLGSLMVEDYESISTDVLLKDGYSLVCKSKDVCISNI